MRPRGDAGGGCREHRLLVVGGRLRHARRAARHRGPAQAPGVAVRRVEAHRRVAAARPGDRDRRVGASAPPHLAALLQRRRLGRPHASTTPARTTCSRSSSRRSSRGARPASTATTTTPPTARTCATTCTSPTSRPPTSSRRSASLAGEPIEPAYNLGSQNGPERARDHGRDGPRHRHRLHARDRARAAPATPTASSRPASSPRATSTGRTATRSTRWSAPAGRPAGPQRPVLSERAKRRGRCRRARRPGPLSRVRGRNTPHRRARSLDS